MTTDERILGKLEKYRAVDAETGCWIWTGSKVSGPGGIRGRVLITHHKTRTREKVHRAAYRLYVGPIPDGHGVLRGSAADLIGGNTEAVARLIVSKLAHKHGLRPAGK